MVNTKIGWGGAGQITEYGVQSNEGTGWLEYGV